MHGISVPSHTCASGDSMRILTKWIPTSLCSECGNAGTLLSPLKKRPTPEAAVLPLPQTELPPHSPSSFTTLCSHSSLQTGTSLLSCELAYYWMGVPATTEATPNAGGRGAHASSVIKKRRKKMNKHKYRKRRREQRFLRRRHGRS